MLNKKKGNLLDWFLIIAIMFMFAIVVIACLKLLNEVDKSNVFADDANADANLNESIDTIKLHDNLLFFVLIGLSIFTLVSAYFVFNHPIFFFVGLVILIVAVIMAAMFSNAYETFSSSTNISDTSIYFPKIQFIMDNLPIYILFMGLITLVVMGISYTKDG